MKKRIISLLLALVLAATLLPVQAWGATVVASGDCGDQGDNVTWVLDSDGVLTINGEGKIKDYSYVSHVRSPNTPWYKNRNEIKNIVVSGNITYIGNYAFYNCNKAENISLSSNITSIGDYAFSDCSGITSISLPSGVRLIGEKAFASCSDLDNFTIPDSVTSIGTQAFYGCYTLTSIRIPSRVEAIGDGAFADCRKLKEISVDTNNRNFLSDNGILFSKDRSSILSYPIEKDDSRYEIPNGTKYIRGYAFYNSDLADILIPDSVTFIGDHAFSRCLKLTAMDVPDSVTAIGAWAFCECQRIKKITLPAGISSIEEYTFGLCLNLVNITVPRKVTTIDKRAFYKCGKMESITLYGDILSIASAAFSGCNSLSDVFFYGSEQQWSSIKIGSFNTPLTSATIHYNSSGPQGDDGEPSTIYNKKPTNLALTVYENKKESNVRETDYRLSSGAAVSCGNSKGTTGKNGQVTLSYTGGDVTVSKNGYVSRTISEAALKVNPTVWLQKESDAYPVISAVWMDDVNDIMNAEYFLPLVQDTSHTVRAEVNWGNSSMQSLKLTQGTTTLDISDSRNTDIKWSDKFDLSREILVVATNADGKTASKTLKISSGSKELSTLDEFTFGCGDDLGFTLPEDIPIVGGLKMKLGVYSPVPICYSIENGKIYLAIGYQVDADDDPNSASGIKEYVDAAKVLRKTISDAKDSIDSYKQIRSAMKAFKGKTAVLKGSWGMDCGFSIVGFYEGYYDKDYNLRWIDGGVVIDINGGISYNQPFVIGPVPCYAEAALNAEAQAKLNLLIAEAVKKITPDGVISGEISLDLGVGAGMKAIATLGGGVMGTASSTVAYASQAISSAQIKLGLEGYFKVTALFFEKKWPITLAEKIVYEYPDYTSQAAYTMEGDETGDFYDTVYDTSSYSQPDLSYLASGSPFLANGSGVMLQAARAVTVDSASTFQSNTYQNAAPQLLCLSDGTMMAVWTGYDSSRSGMNALCLYYARYDGSSWSEPAVLDNDGTMDCGFTLREINGAPCVVWENAASAIESSDDLDAVAAKMSISAARYVDGAFVIERVSDAAGADMMPDVCAVNDGLAVVWLRNESGDLFANDGTNKIVCRTMTGEGWSEESVLYSGLNSADSLAVGSSGDTLQVAYSMDTDGDLTTSADMEVYINGSAATSDSVIDSGVQYENGQLYWYKDGALMCGGSEMVPAASKLRSDRYQVVEGSGVKAVLFTQSNGVYSSLYGIFCDTASGTWGEPVALTDGSDYIQSFSATPSANGLQVVVNRLAVTGDGSTGDPYGEARMDILDLTLGCDLAVKDVYCDMQYYVAGNKLPVTVTVANKGRQAVSQVKVTFLAENGTELGTETLDISLPAGVTQEIETGFTVKDVVQGQKITVQVTPVDNTDINTADNAAELTLQQHDIALENMSWGVNSSGQAVIYADVVNRGYTASGTLTVSLRKGSETGEAIGSVTVDSLDTLGLQRVSFETAYEEGVVYYLTLDACEDDSIANNSDFVVLRKETTTTGKTVSGTLQAAGLPQGETIRITLSQGDAVCYELSAGEGSFSFTDVEPGSYTMTLYHEGFVSHSYALTVDGNLLNLTAQIVQRGNVNGATTYGKAIDASDIQCLYEILTIGKYDSSCITDKEYLNDVADVNMDGTVDVYDLQLLYETVSGIV